jgi:hypothetical protein
MVIVHFLEIDQRGPRAAGLAQPDIVAVVGVGAAVRVRENAILDVIEPVGAAQRRGDRDRHRESPREPDPGRSLQDYPPTLVLEALLQFRTEEDAAVVLFPVPEPGERCQPDIEFRHPATPPGQDTAIARAPPGP